MDRVGRTLYWIMTAAALVLAGFAALEYSGAETAKGNAMMRAALLFIAAVAVWSLGRAVLRALSGR